jgi:hypothetical protein
MWPSKGAQTSFSGLPRDPEGDEGMVVGMGHRDFRKLLCHRDTVFGCTVLVLGVVLLVHIHLQPWSAIHHQGLVGPSTFPNIITILILALGFASLYGTYSDYRQSRLQAYHDRIVSGESVTIVLAGVAFAFLINELGFLGASVIFLSFLFWYWGERSWIAIIAVSIIATVLTYLSAVYLLSIDLPPGVLWSHVALF